MYKKMQHSQVIPKTYTYANFASKSDILTRHNSVLSYLYQETAAFGISIFRISKKSRIRPHTFLWLIPLEYMHGTFKYVHHSYNLYYYIYLM